ncbi:MAG TPA: tripartite tricarboxylate transporter TctB family protein [Negativicutes bacterium]|nr:tripartite tricarboxylate transporter TctB family protein [Negativicutes bacterium]
MKRWERLSATALFLVGIGGAFGAWKIGFGSFQSPGPGFFPFWLATLLTITCLVFFLRNLGADLISVSLWTKGSWQRPAKAAGVMFIYVLLIGQLGFISSTALMFVAWSRIVEHSSWKSAALLVVCGTAGLYLFSTVLAIPLPKGFLI